jgi:hypothetical protein
VNVVGAVSMRWAVFSLVSEFLSLATIFSLVSALVSDVSGIDRLCV